MHNEKGVGEQLSRCSFHGSEVTELVTADREEIYMARMNRATRTATKKARALTHEGAPAVSAPNALEQLRRSVMACMLWEDTFYESGEDIADRIARTVELCRPADVAQLAVEARGPMNLRHAPLWLLAAMFETDSRLARSLAGLTIPDVIQRPDEMGELLRMYWRAGRRPIPNAMKRGLAEAFTKFDAYRLAKYNRAGDGITLRDVMFMVHPKPKDEEQAATWKALVDGTLPSPDTWEVALSGGADKTETWTRLLNERKLGALALLRNLRNMEDACVPRALVANALDHMHVDRVLPFRFLAAARHAPQHEPALERAMYRALADRTKLPGRTALLVDASGSMFTRLSARSELQRFDAGCGVAILAREICDDVNIYTFSHTAVPVPPRRGFALRDALYAKAERGGTYTETAKRAADLDGYDRIIIITDEQSHEAISAPLPTAGGRGYVVNVAAYENGIGYGPWTTISGWSEAVIDYIQTAEQERSMSAKARASGDAVWAAIRSTRNVAARAAGNDEGDDNAHDNEQEENDALR